MSTLCRLPQSRYHISSPNVSPGIQEPNMVFFCLQIKYAICNVDWLLESILLTTELYVCFIFFTFLSWIHKLKTEWLTWYREISRHCNSKGMYSLYLGEPAKHNSILMMGCCKYTMSPQLLSNVFPWTTCATYTKVYILHRMALVSVQSLMWQVTCRRIGVTQKHRNWIYIFFLPRVLKDCIFYGHFSVYQIIR